MNQRNKLVASVAVAAATAAIGTGALISSNAMAASTDPGKATVTVVSASSDGSTPISCTFNDVTLPKTVGLGPIDGASGVVSTAKLVTGSGSSGQIVTGSATAISDGAVPPGNPPAGGTVAVSVSAGEGALAPASALPAGANPIAILSSDARPGTAAECSAIESKFVPGP